MEAASAPDTKKIATRTMTTMLATVLKGNASRVVKSCVSTPPAPAMSVPFCCRSIAAPPKMANQTMLTRLGTSRTPVTN